MFRMAMLLSAALILSGCGVINALSEEPSESDTGEPSDIGHDADAGPVEDVADDASMDADVVDEPDTMDVEHDADIADDADATADASDADVGEELIIDCDEPELAFDEGAGTEEAPYIVEFAAQLEIINCDESTLSAHYELADDLVLPEGFEPLGSSEMPFTGGFYGEGYGVDNLVLYEPNESDLGFFGTLNGATVSDIELRQAVVVGEENVGLLAGRVVDSQIDAIAVTGDVTGESHVGGAIGFVEDSTIRHSASGAHVEMYSAPLDSLSEGAGGLAGAVVGSESAVEASLARGNIYSNGRFAGGLVGHLEGAIISDSYAMGSVIGAREGIGGLVGYLSDEATVERVYALGEIETGSGNALHGFADYVAGSSDNSSTEVSDAYYNEAARCTAGFQAVVNCSDEADGLDPADIVDNTRQESLFDGFDWETTWSTAEHSPPRLAWEDYGDCDPGDEPFGGGEGSEGEPYLICSPEQFEAIDGHLDDHFRLASDILRDGGGYPSIGDDDTLFQGTLDGAGYRIASFSGAVLFRNLGNSSRIQNLTIGDASSLDGGVLAQSTSGEISRVHVTAHTENDGPHQGLIVGEASSGAHLEDVRGHGFLVESEGVVGGLVGQLEEASITNGRFSGGLLDNPGPGIDQLTGMGGLVGRADNATITDGTTGIAPIEFGFSSAENVGGIVGESLNETTITDCRVLGGLIHGVNAVGGVVGHAEETTIEGCYTNVALRNLPEFSENFGGIAGILSTDAEIIASLAEVAITGNDDGGSISIIGGLVGSMEDASTVESSAAMALIDGGDSVGGAVGRMNTGAELTSSYAKPSGDHGLTTSSGASPGLDGREHVGGLIGELQGATVIDAYASIEGTNPPATPRVRGANYVGGLIGRIFDEDSTEVEIDRSYAAINISASGNDSEVGGLVGNYIDELPLQRSHWDNDISGLSGPLPFEFLGTDQTTSTMTDGDCDSLDWCSSDGLDAWHFSTGSYPRLQWEGE